MRPNKAIIAAVAAVPTMSAAPDAAAQGGGRERTMTAPRFIISLSNATD